MAQEITMNAADVLKGFQTMLPSMKTTNRLYNPATLVLGAVFNFIGVEMKDDGSGNWADRYRVIVVEGPNVAPLTRESISPITGMKLGNKGDKPRQESLMDNENIEFPIRSLMGSAYTEIVTAQGSFFPGKTAMTVIQLFQLILGKVIKVKASGQHPQDVINLPGGITRKRTHYVIGVYDTVEAAQADVD